MKKNRKILIIVLISLFILLSILVKLNLTTDFDNLVYDIITSNISDGNTKFYKIITFLGSAEFIVFLCFFFLILFIILKRKNIGLIITLCLVISTIINNLIKVIMRRSRPEVEKLVIETSFSYPSGHTMAAFSMYGMLIYLIMKSNINKNIKVVVSIILGIIPIMVAISRIYLGAHFATDVIGAFLVSIILLLVEINYIDKKGLI